MNANENNHIPTEAREHDVVSALTIYIYSSFKIFQHEVLVAEWSKAPD